MRRTAQLFSSTRPAPPLQNIFDVLTYLTPLLVLLTFSGRVTLLTLAKTRVKTTKSD
jgi:hypothetical protein